MEQHFISVFTMQQRLCWKTVVVLCVAAVQFGDVRDFLVIPTLATAGMPQARLNNTLEYGISLGKYFHLSIKIYC